MTFPQPAGYYSLPLSESAESLITSLDYKQTFNLLYDVVFCESAEVIGTRFYAMSLSLVKWFEDEIDALSPANKIALIRWLSDRLAFLHNVPVQEVTK
ncbi:hypothetical protein PseudUWO311_00645 [Pseudanabaena sp. UWO311]|uniref:hypothetical protein n=1 Tax=Pseudanabaena sp. UWO311 TaxID=2487337 RepID=UPI001157490C|nr:hypothetical protein [Pseudanabaena sp. UWO311]TYQ29439.1 hypothetical protein PseudUWO311_00645 [Pseudanabaena sp. UWO311]